MGGNRTNAKLFAYKNPHRLVSETTGRIWDCLVEDIPAPDTIVVSPDGWGLVTFDKVCLPGIRDLAPPPALPRRSLKSLKPTPSAQAMQAAFETTDGRRRMH